MTKFLKIKKLVSRHTKGFQAINEHMLLQNCGGFQAINEHMLLQNCGK